MAVVMGVLSAPWVDLALLLRHITETSHTDSLVPLWVCGLVLFLSVCLLLIQLIIYFNWKLRQVEDDLSITLKTGAIYRPMGRSSDCKRRSFGSHTNI